MTRAHARRLAQVAGIVCGLVLLWVILVYPALVESARQAPLVQVLAAVQRGDIAGVRACFTEDATVRAGEVEMGIGPALLATGPLIQARGQQARWRFDGFRDPKVTGRRLESEFWIYVDVERPDAPGNYLPLHKQGHVVLEQQGFLRWRIKTLAADDNDFGRVLQGQEY